MKRDTPLLIALALLATVVLLIVMILWNRNVEQRGRIGSLEAQIAEHNQSREGGAETDLPPVRESGAEYRFPIAASDYRQLTSPFGYRLSPVFGVERHHTGVDVSAVWRAQVVAVADGVVVEHWPPPDDYYRGHDVFGGLLVIEHENGWRSLYGHLSDTRVHTGWEIEGGQIIGRVGNTGRSDGAHLHFELHDASGQRLNPLVYLEQPQEATDAD
jgi:murein DD-endopeptidase MepM/ murein hydrolase activator NlpD